MEDYTAARTVARQRQVPQATDTTITIVGPPAATIRIRVLMYAAPIAMLKKLPSVVDLRSKFPPAYDQGELGSCTANAIAGAIQFGRRKHKQKPDFIPSRLFIYYNERAMEGTVSVDSGAQIRDGIKSVVKQGACSEKTWPYQISSSR